MAHAGASISRASRVIRLPHREMPCHEPPQAGVTRPHASRTLRTHSSMRRAHSLRPRGIRAACCPNTPFNSLFTQHITTTKSMALIRALSHSAGYVMSAQAYGVHTRRAPLPDPDRVCTARQVRGGTFILTNVGPPLPRASLNI